MTDFDSILKSVGEFGLFQKKIFLLVQLASIPLFFQNLVLVFVAAQPKWSCIGTPNDLCTPNGTICSKAVFSSEFTSIATEWNLVCSKAYKNELVQSLFMAGNMIGSPWIGGLADQYGRKKLWMISVVLCSFVSFVSAFVKNYNHFLILRFMCGAFAGGGGLVTFVLSTESVGPSYRGMVGTLAQVCFALAIAALGVVAYYIRDWRAVVVATSIPSLFSLLVFKFIPESPRWLTVKGRIKEAENILYEAAKENGVGHIRFSLSRACAKSDVKSTTKYGMTDLFTKPSVRMITVIMLISWFVNSLVYYGLSLNVKNLGGNMYATFIFSGLVEIPSYLLTVAFLSWFGRRNTLFGFMMGGAAACFACMKLQGLPDFTFFMASAAMAGKFCISASFAVIYVYAAELYPTVVRNIGMGVATLAARIGGIVAPLIVLLAEYDNTLPMLVFAGAALVAGVIGLKLPETKGKSLPETLEEDQATQTSKVTRKGKLD